MKLTHSLFLVVFLLSLSGCLKTRAQLREESDRGGASPISVQPAQDVQPQGHYVIDELKSEITRLSGRVEDLERELSADASSADSEESNELKKFEARLAQLEKIQSEMNEKLQKIHDGVGVALKNPEELLAKAKSHFQDEEYSEAVELLGTYLKAPKIKKAEEATFLRGEGFYKLKQYKKAIVEYSKFPEKFGRSSRTPEALYKTGLSFDALDMQEDAKGFYQELVEKFPKSPEAKKAKKKIKN